VVEHVAVLGVHVDHHPDLPGRVQHAHDPLVADPELVDHEHLEARVAEVDQPRDLGQRLIARVAHDDVEAVVDVRAPRRPGLPTFDRHGQRLPALLPGVVADGGDAAAGGGRGARLEVVHAPEPAHVRVEVGVHVDAARQPQERGGVDLAETVCATPRPGWGPQGRSIVYQCGRAESNPSG
jgi:hypothetical protein